MIVKVTWNGYGYSPVKKIARSLGGRVNGVKKLAPAGNHQVALVNGMFSGAGLSRLQNFFDVWQIQVCFADIGALDCIDNLLNYLS